MGEGSFHGLPQVVRRGHVINRVVDEHGVEQAAQSQGPHVALQVLTLRVQRAAHLQHAGRQISQCHVRKVLLEVGRIVPTPGPQLQQGGRCGQAGTGQQLPEELRFVGIILGRG
jgi:hypothetical protein